MKDNNNLNKSLNNLDNVDNEELVNQLDKTSVQDTSDIVNEGNNPADVSAEINELKTQLEQKSKENEEYLNLLQRTYAEFDNYKKRTAKEKEVLYSNSIIDIMTNVLPVIDNLEMALESCKGEDGSKIVEGVEMILKQLKDMLKKYKVTEIEAIKQQFNPVYHEAVMHIEDENFGESEITEVLRKGYKCGDKVLRHSMVKVAN